MRKSILLAIALITLTVAAAPAPAAPASVSITKVDFVPGSVTINQGETVTWTNADTENHQVISQKAGLASPVLKPGESFAFTFKTAGAFQVQDAFEKRLKGSVDVKEIGAAQTVSLAASTAQVVYGRSVTLSGTISGKVSGEKVTVLRQPFGTTSFATVATVTTGDGGAWTLAVKPTIRTVYQVRWKTATSATTTVTVRPLVTLRVLTGGRFFTKVSAGRSFAGRYVQLQRKSSFGQWVTVKRVRLGSTSAATFRATLPRGTSTLRTAISVNQAGAGYLAGFSRTIVFARP